MLVVTLTGGIASGKSTTSQLLSSPPHSLPVIDLDVLARQVVEPNDPSRSLSKLVSHFGPEILQSDGTLDRPTLGRIAFGEGNEEKRKILNKITHSAIRKRLAWLVCKHWLKGTKVLIIDTPLAVEAGLWRWCGEMLLVWCTSETQLSRMLKRDGPKGLTEGDAQSRLASQLPLDNKRAYADVVLDNSDDSQSGLEKQVAQVVNRWKKQTDSGVGWWKTTLEWLVPPFGICTALLAILGRGKRVGQKKKEEGKDR